MQVHKCSCLNSEIGEEQSKRDDGGRGGGAARLQDTSGRYFGVGIEENAT